MFNISCDICIDLIPLVKDQVASEDSQQAVKDHLKTCPTCFSLYEDEAVEIKPVNDKRVLEKIKRKVYFGALTIAVLGALVGLALTESAGLFYNILIMPTIGLIGFYALQKKWYYVPLSLFLLSYVWLLITYLSQGILDEPQATLFYALTLPANWALIYSGLAMLGVVIGALLKIAFRKEET